MGGFVGGANEKLLCGAGARPLIDHASQSKRFLCSASRFVLRVSLTVY